MIGRTLAATDTICKRREAPVLFDRRSVSVAVLATMLAGGFTRALAKESGLIFVSNEKSNNLIVLDPKTYKIVRHFKVDAASITVRTLSELARRGEVKRESVREAIDRYDLSNVNAAPVVEAAGGAE